MFTLKDLYINMSKVVKCLHFDGVMERDSTAFFGWWVREGARRTLGWPDFCL